ncbi:hypothetical protein VSQ48_23230 [Candidatus Ventrimonas sp. KK005]
MNRSYSRDVQVLGHILKNQMNIRDAVKRLGCDFSQVSSKSILNDKLAFDACSMYMAQIGEHIKLLTDYSKEELNKFIDIQTLRYFRNMIDHSYEKVNKLYLMPYIQIMQSDKTMQQVKQIIQECNKRKNS